MSAEILSFCKKYLRDMPDLPIRQSQMLVLGYMCSVSGVHTPAALAVQMGVSKAMISSHVAALIKAGMIMRVPSPEDGRSVYLVATKRGVALVEKFNAANQKKLDMLAVQMGQSRFNNFMKLIAVANKALDNLD